MKYAGDVDPVWSYPIEHNIDTESNASNIFSVFITPLANFWVVANSSELLHKVSHKLLACPGISNHAQFHNTDKISACRLCQAKAAHTALRCSVTRATASS